MWLSPILKLRFRKQTSEKRDHRPSFNVCNQPRACILSWSGEKSEKKNLWRKMFNFRVSTLGFFSFLLFGIFLWKWTLFFRYHLLLPYFGKPPTSGCSGIVHEISDRIIMTSPEWLKKEQRNIKKTQLIFCR